MSLENYIKHSDIKVRDMTHDEIFEYHREYVVLPEGMGYDEFVKRIKYLAFKLELRPTEEQLHLVLCSCADIPVGVESCPGSGKTTISQFIVYVYHLIYKINPHKFLITTFSQQSAVSMQGKNMEYARKLGVAPVGRIKTMHSWYLSFLQEHLSWLKYPVNIKELRVIQTPEALRYLRNSYEQTKAEIVKEKRVSGDKLNTRDTEKTVTHRYIDQLYALYTYIIDAQLTGKHEDIQILKQFKDAKIEYSRMIRVFKAFDDSKFVMGAIDYSDMQVKFLEMIRDHEEIRRQIGRYFDVIMIDEFQDTSQLQLAIYTLLATKENRKRFLVIGDNDQAIYRWRGTSKAPFDDFFKEFTDGQLVVLGYNMRSGKDIIGHANKLIRHTKHRVDKDMTSPREIVDSVEVAACKSKMHAVNIVYKDILKNFNGDYEALKDVCVLVRNHNQAMWLVDNLVTGDTNIPVKLMGGNFPYNDKIIIDLAELVEMVQNPGDVELVSRNLSKLSRWITGAHKRDIEIQVAVGKKLWEIEPSFVSNGRSQKSIQDDLAKLKELGERFTAESTVGEICRELVPMYFQGSYEYYAKMQSIDPEHYELIFDYMTAQDATLNTFKLKLERIKERLNYNTNMDTGIRIGSMHSVKGLEFKKVYLLDCSGNVCPNQNTIDGLLPKQALEYIEEERNLFYVAITRAEQELMVTYNANFPSMFNVESGLIHKEHIINAQIVPEYVDVEPEPVPVPAPAPAPVEDFDYGSYLDNLEF